MKQASFTETLKEYAVITLATLIVAAAVFFFLVPAHLAVGSISGLVVVLAEFLPFRVSVMTFVLNTVLLVFGFFTIGKDFGAKTVYTSILLPAFIGMFELMFPQNVSMTGDGFLDMLGYVFVVSIGLAVLFNHNASSGGLDIIAKFLNKYFRVELGMAMSLAGMFVALSSGLVSDAKTVFLSVLGTYLNGIVLDHFILGFNVRKRVCIISEKHEQVVDYLVHTLGCGATLYEATGAYDKKKKTEVITILGRGEYAKLMSWLNQTDPEAFVTVYTVKEVIRRQTAN